MRIALVNRDIQFDVSTGGICRNYVALAHQLSALGHEVHVVTGCPNTAPLPDGVFIKEVKCETASANEYCSHVADAVASVDPDVAECSSWEFELLHYVRRPREARADVVVRAEFSAKAMGDVPTYKQEAEAELLAKAGGAIAVSKFVAREIEGAYGVKISTVIHNGIDLNRFGPVQVANSSDFKTGYRIHLDQRGEVVGKDHLSAVGLLSKLRNSRLPIILWIGRITSQKGWPELESLVAELRSYANFIVVVGEAPARVPVNINNYDNVNFIQGLGDEEMPLLYCVADYHLSTAKVEGFGNSLLEAIACGTTLLVPSRLEAVFEYATEGESVLVYETASDIQTAISAQVQLVPQVPPDYSWERNAQRTIDVYSSLVSSHPRLGRQTAGAKTKSRRGSD